MTQATPTLPFDGQLNEAADDPQRLTAMLPSPCPQNHAANLLPLPNGDLMCVWFGGTQEGSRYLCLLLASEQRQRPLERAAEAFRRSGPLRAEPGAVSRTR